MLVGGGMQKYHDQFMKRFEEDSTRNDSTIGKQRTLMSKRKDGSEFPCIIGIKRVPEKELLIGYVRNVSQMESAQQQTQT